MFKQKMMSSYEKQLRILTVLLLGGIFHREVHLMAMRLYRIAVIPDSTIQEVILDDLMFSSGGMLDAKVMVGGKTFANSFVVSTMVPSFEPSQERAWHGIWTPSASSRWLRRSSWKISL